MCFLLFLHLLLARATVESLPAARPQNRASRGRHRSRRLSPRVPASQLSRSPRQLALWRWQVIAGAADTTPSPSTSGISMSVTTKSGAEGCTSLSASRPDPASTTRRPPRRRIWAKRTRSSASSSTTSPNGVAMSRSATHHAPVDRTSVRSTLRLEGAACRFCFEHLLADARSFCRSLCEIPRLHEADFRQRDVLDERRLDFRRRQVRHDLFQFRVPGERAIDVRDGIQPFGQRVVLRARDLVRLQPARFRRLDLIVGEAVGQRARQLLLDRGLEARGVLRRVDRRGP